MFFDDLLTVSDVETGSRDDGSKRIRVKLDFELLKVGPQDVGWRETLDGIRGLIAVRKGKVTNEHVEAT